MSIVKHVRRQGNLMQIVLALHAPSSFASGLNCGQEQPNQNANNSNHDQEFDQRESISIGAEFHKHLSGPDSKGCASK